MAAFTAKESGKCSPAVCPREKKKVFSEWLARLCQPLPFQLMAEIKTKTKPKTIKKLIASDSPGL